MRCVLPVSRMYVTGRNFIDMGDDGRGFFCLLRVVLSFVDGLRLSLSFFCRFPQGLLGLGVRSGGEAMVVRGYPGYIPGFTMWMWILRRVFRILLAVGNIAHSSLPAGPLSLKNICFVTTVLLRRPSRVPKALRAAGKPLHLCDNRDPINQGHVFVLVS